MDKKTKSLLPTIIIVFLSIALYHIFNNFTSFLTQLSNLGKILSPITIGFIIFYLLNIPMKIFERKLFHKVKKQSTKRLLSVLLTIISVLAFLAFTVGIVVPSLTQNIIALSSQLQDIINSAIKFFDNLPNYVKDLTGFKIEYDTIVETFFKSFTSYLNSFVSDVGSFFSSAVSGVYTMFMALAISIYMLFGKEDIKNALSQVCDTYLSKKFMCRTRRYLKELDKSFEVFIKGQIFEGFILGVLSYILMTIFRFDYALLISFLIGVTNVIPIIGPYIGAIPSFLLLLALNPMKAALFLPYIIALQQVEGNIIYPRVVGDAMGISGFWIMVVVVVGNGLFGVAGILIGIPLFAAFYTILKEDIKKRNKVDEDKSIELDPKLLK